MHQNDGKIAITGIGLDQIPQSILYNFLLSQGDLRSVRLIESDNDDCMLACEYYDLRSASHAVNLGRWQLHRFSLCLRFYDYKARDVALWPDDYPLMKRPDSPSGESQDHLRSASSTYSISNNDRRCCTPPWISGSLVRGPAIWSESYHVGHDRQAKLFYQQISKDVEVNRSSTDECLLSNDHEKLQERWLSNSLEADLPSSVSLSNKSVHRPNFKHDEVRHASNKHHPDGISTHESADSAMKEASVSHCNYFPLGKVSGHTAQVTFLCRLSKHC